MLRRAIDALPSLPDHSGLRSPGGELWRADARARPRPGRRPSPARRTSGATCSPATVGGANLVLLGPESGRRATALSDDDVLDALAQLRRELGRRG